jgi:hypothetical protein
MTTAVLADLYGIGPQADKTQLEASAESVLEIRAD